MCNCKAALEMARVTWKVLLYTKLASPKLQATTVLFRKHQNWEQPLRGTKWKYWAPGLYDTTLGFYVVNALFWFLKNPSVVSYRPGAQYFHFVPRNGCSQFWCFLNNTVVACSFGDASLV
jgi:hypothetical protein